MKRVTAWEDIRPGDVWSVHGTAWISRAIQFFTAGRWNHSGLVLRRDAAGNLWCQEALDSIQETYLSTYKEEFDRGDLAIFRATSPQAATDFSLAWTATKTGQRYPWAGTASLALFVPLNWLLGKFGKQLPTPFRAHEKCSELVFLMLRKRAEAADLMGLPHCVDLDWVFTYPDQESFTPNSLVLACDRACRDFPT